MTKLMHGLERGLDVAREIADRVLHSDSLASLIKAVHEGAEPQELEWALVYRTAQGFCGIYRDTIVELRDMLDVQIWAQEMALRTYFIGM